MYSGWSIEIWVMFLLSALTALLRIIVRTKMVGVRGWKGDDYMIIVAVLFFLLETIVQWEVVPEVDLAASRGLLSTENKKANEALIRRSNKFIFVGWIFYVCTIWSLKGCMLFFYYRLTSGLGKNRIVTFGTILCALTWVVSIMTIFVHCTPISENWNPFTTKKQCQTFVLNTYVIVTANVLTDAYLLCIPIPIVWKVRLPLKRKLALGLLMCSGIFVMFASAMRLVMTLFNSMSTGTIIEEAIWPYREIFIAMIVVNAPCVKPFFSSSTWLKSSSYAPSSTGHSSSSKGKLSYFSMSRSQKDNTTTNTILTGDAYNPSHGGCDVALDSVSGRIDPHNSQGSQEYINQPPASHVLQAMNTPRRESDSSTSSRREKDSEALVIMTSTTFDVSRNEMKDLEEGRCGSMTRVGSRCGFTTPRTPIASSVVEREVASMDGGRPVRGRQGSFWMSDDEESIREHVYTIEAGGRRR